MNRNLRVLFVDDEPKVLDGLRRMLHPMRDQWDTSFAPGGPEALAILARRPFDVIVADMRMPKMTGAELLQAVRRGYPTIARLVLSGQASHKTILAAVTQTHQYLPKPCKSETLRHVLGRLSALRELLVSERLRGAITGLQCLPSHPSRHRRFVEGAQSPDTPVELLGQIVARDLAMSAKVLQLVSSAFFGQPKQGLGPEEAVSFLGLDIVRALACSHDVFRPLRDGRSVPLIETLSRHSLLVAQIAKAIAQDAGAQVELVQQAYVGGMLHDIGKLLLTAELPQEVASKPPDTAAWKPHYDQAVPGGAAGEGAEVEPGGRQAAIECGLENSRLGDLPGHGEIGAYLLGLWGLPDPVVEAVAFHRQPSRSGLRAAVNRGLETSAPGASAFSPLAAVHAAEALVRNSERHAGTGLPAGLDAGYLGAAGLLERLPTWQQICRQVMEKEAAYEREDTLCRR